MDMNEFFKTNLEQALQLQMPNKSFASLNMQDDFVSIMVRPGLINKHLTAKQLEVLVMVEKFGAVKSSANHGFIVSIPKIRLEMTIEAFTKVGLYAIPNQPSATIKCCDFCDGERLEALPIAEKLLQVVEQFPLEKRVRIGFNACTEACYNAVYDDLALIYYNGKFDLYAGAIQMGRRANAGKLLVKKIEEEQILTVVQYLLERFEQSNCKTFSSFIQKEQHLEQELRELQKVGMTR